jgi:hypothetical protein
VLGGNTLNIVKHKNSVFGHSTQSSGSKCARSCGSMVSGWPRAGGAADVLWPLPLFGVPLHPNLKKMTADQRKGKILVTHLHRRHLR